ncbi:Ferredoxin [Candidatus Syntrophocurvum alkaliphilum]|uniref:Ferredoxin n=1 Tax=Candidatus Syntrophocurvum alkaliphilum TaxID=2293317 RepID=A0A6I6DBS7_9FIRM|nr:aldo/keto reductase [Candidatus Syntrophocurvum alkaliphilum]QGT98904.1 Ferredoxin [Candidatus Syntrophocurvum alkaliphilum]
MQYLQLGSTNLIVSKLCFGVLTIGPLQSNLSINEGSDILSYSMEKGINFFDTAKSYKTYPYIREAIKKTGIRPVITSKSYDYTYRGMQSSVEEALDEMQVDYIDVFMLHEQENSATLQGHKEAINYLIKARDKGIIKAIGISTHTVDGVLAGAFSKDIEVIHPLINRKGIGIIGGSAEQMIAAMSHAFDKGKGIYAMKALGGGNLISEAHSSFEFVKNLDCIHSMAVGMKSTEEIDLNIAWMENKRDLVLEKKVSSVKRNILIEDWCELCGECIRNCSYEALYLKNSKVEVDSIKCILCGYCAKYCENFCIKMV